MYNMYYISVKKILWNISHIFVLRRKPCGSFSVSDLNMPVNELVRLVRVYSTPWEEKSAALKKLHEDYENKQRQLNIAVKRLQLVDAHVGCVCFKNYIKIYLTIKKLQYIITYMYNLYSISCLLF